MVFSLSSGPPNLIHNFLTSERPQALSPGRGSAACLEQSSLPYSSCCFGVRSFLLGPHGRFPLARALPSSLRKAAYRDKGGGARSLPASALSLRAFNVRAADACLRCGLNYF
ncbi:unnamed protein product [Prorocentrum cordatum]|uniref:Uncharacterized protein n=1 Tax=Prorocentrum cordatum TaxID=2364126 RepID=A0ABN9UPT1_9DINO|nr:unnamed protein product [Polarella glacialis]